jgi:dienelactone hydrolase
MGNKISERIKVINKRIISKSKVFLKARLKLSDGWKGASICLAFASLILFLMQSVYMFFSHGAIDLIKAYLIIILIVLILSIVIVAIFKLINRMPGTFAVIFLGSFILLCFSFFSPSLPMMITAFFIALIFSLLGGLIYKFGKGNYRHSRLLKKVSAASIASLLAAAVVSGAFYLGREGKYSSVESRAIVDNKIKGMNLDNPTLTGQYSVKTLTYGSGKDFHNISYSNTNSITTSTVDGSAFVSGWSKLREKYLGFGPKEMPLNGIVWYPEGNGTFPLVVVAHGNHLMTEESEAGYEYIGRLLASRGYIVVSIDENFLNMSLYDDLLVFKGLKEENDARAFVILEHIRQWKDFNTNKNNIFYNKVDMNNIALIGHSRGGEAVAVAAEFNKLNSYPDNGNIKFNYNFNIKSVVAIAPTDGQYKPAKRSTELKDINYLVFHGAHDMDVTSFIGSSQYDRVSFTGEKDCFKAAVYIDKANHGQFNNNWGRKDGVGLGNKLFNLKQLMPQEEQQQIAKVLAISFIETTLRNKLEYRSLFKNINYAEAWLPETRFINNYLDSNTKLIATFEEDADLNSATISGTKLSGSDFKLWKEKRIEMKAGQKQNSAVDLEWDKVLDGKAATYSVEFKDSNIKLLENSKIVFSMADDSSSSPVQFKVKVVDKSGRSAELPFVLPSMIEGEIFKKPLSYLVPTKEPVFQSFEISLKDIKNINLDFNIKEISSIIFIFDNKEKGHILIDDIGVSEEINNG